MQKRKLIKQTKKIAQALGLELGLQMKKKNMIFGLRSFTIMKIRPL